MVDGRENLTGCLVFYPMMTDKDLGRRMRADLGSASPVLSPYSNYVGCSHQLTSSGRFPCNSLLQYVIIGVLFFT